MSPDDTTPQGSGDDFDDEPTGPSWLPPDDRLWRHPSEVAGDPVATRMAAAPARWHFARRLRTSQWVVGVISGLVGALVAAGVLAGTGALGAGTPVITTMRSNSVVSVPPTSSAGGMTAIVDMVSPSVVGVNVNGAQGQAAGSGVIVSSTGNTCYLVTDSSLFDQAGPSSQVQVSDYWGGSAPGHLVGTDPSAGIAVVKFSLSPCASSAATAGTVASVQTGEPVVAVGAASVAIASNASPFASGYISDTATYLAPVNGATDGMYSMLVANLDTGQSGVGDAVVDGTGEVLGIAMSPAGSPGMEGVDYVAPIDLVMADVTAIIKTGQPAPHPWLGVTQATDISGPGAQRMGLKGAVQVQNLAAGSPAAKAGLQDNDVLTAISGQKLSSVGQLIAWLATAPPGEVCSLNWLHDGKARHANITLGQQPPSVNS